MSLHCILLTCDSKNARALLHIELLIVFLETHGFKFGTERVFVVYNLIFLKLKFLFEIRTRKSVLNIRVRVSLKSPRWFLMKCFHDPRIKIMKDIMLVETSAKTNFCLKEKLLELLRLKHMLMVFVGVGVPSL